MDDVASTLFRTQLLERRSRLETARTAHPKADHLASLLHEVDAALERMDDGSYGLCEYCHEPVEAARLLADPLTRFCIDHLNAEQQRALQQDLDLALRIQTSLLPQRNLRADGWEACYHYEPAGPVSGDYCDLVASDAGGVFFITADVSGKGVASSLLMSHLHAIFHSLLSISMPIGALLERANRVFCESTLPSFYATVVCGCAYPGGEVEICNAGHCPPLMVRRDGTTSIEATALPLGLFCNSEYVASRIRLDPGDALVLYTDGLSEARNRADEEYGPERLTRVVRGAHGQSPQGVTNTCLADLEGFLAGAAKSDDVTLMVVRRAA